MFLQNPRGSASQRVATVPSSGAERSEQLSFDGPRQQLLLKLCHSIDEWDMDNQVCWSFNTLKNGLCPNKFCTNQREEYYFIINKAEKDTGTGLADQLVQADQCAPGSERNSTKIQVMNNEGKLLTSPQEPCPQAAAHAKTPTQSHNTHKVRHENIFATFKYCL